MEHKPKRFKDLLNPGKEIRAFGGSLANEFIVPPFSVLDAASSAWANRRREWGKLDMLKVSGRDHDQTYHTEEILKKLLNTTSENTSRFDPVLAEVMYLWFCKDGGRVLDPFAGGHVRGMVAGMTGYEYVGVDLSKRQVTDNYARAAKHKDVEKPPKWKVGDSLKLNGILNDAKEAPFDFIFSCPPYFDLEKYTDKPEDLCNMNDDDFWHAYNMIIKKCVRWLNPNSFAAFVVGDVRGENGRLRGLPQMTINAFQGAGMDFYNDMVLLDPLGSAVLRARRNFIAGKVSKVHQYVLVFVKGDARKAFAQTRVGKTMIKEMKKEKPK